MNKPHMTYFEKDNIIHIALSDAGEASSFEISPNITAELNKDGEVIGIEILSASQFIRDSVLESVQAKLMNLSAVQTSSQVSL